MDSLAHEGVIFLGDCGHLAVYQDYHSSLTMATDIVGLKLSALDGYRHTQTLDIPSRTKSKFQYCLILPDYVLGNIAGASDHLHH